MTIRVLCLIGIMSLMFATFVWAQAAPTPPLPPPASWQMIVATAINTAGVMLVVWLLSTYIFPALRERMPWLVPILSSLIVGPALAAAQNWLAGWLGVPIDLSPIAGAATGVMTGALAVTAHQTYQQQRRVAATGASFITSSLRKL